MKTLFLALIMIATGFTRGESSQFVDKDLGFVVEIPDGVERAWTVHDHKTGFVIDIFHSGLVSEEGFVIAIGKYSIENPSDMCGLCTAVCSTLSEQLETLGLVDEDVEIQFESLLSFAKGTWNEERYRMLVSIDEVGQVEADFHIFIANNHIWVVLTAVFSEGELPPLDAFSQDVVRSVSFTPKQ